MLGIRSFPFGVRLIFRGKMAGFVSGRVVSAQLISLFPQVPNAMMTARIFLFAENPHLNGEIIGGREVGGFGCVTKSHARIPYRNPS